MKVWFSFWPMGQYRIFVDEDELKRMRAAATNNGVDIQMKPIYLLKGHHAKTSAVLVRRISQHLNRGKGGDRKYYK